MQSSIDVSLPVTSLVSIIFYLTIYFYFKLDLKYVIGMLVIDLFLTLRSVMYMEKDDIEKTENENENENVKRRKKVAPRTPNTKMTPQILSQLPILKPIIKPNSNANAHAHAHAHANAHAHAHANTNPNAKVKFNGKSVTTFNSMQPPSEIQVDDMDMQTITESSNEDEQSYVSIEISTNDVGSSVDGEIII